MKIINLKFKNINSLSGENEIDFTKPEFSTNGLFAITGKTGAGKSSILDAITLALYGKTARLSVTSNDNEVMTRGEKDCYAEIVFEAAGKIWKSSWKHARARTGTLKAIERTIADSDNNLVADRAESVNKKITEIIGLSFEQFTKVVMLAQGNFTAFLEADKNKKGELLEQITGTAIYAEISKKVFERCKNEEAKLDKLKYELSAIKILTEEEKTQIYNDIESSENESNALDATLNELIKSLNLLKAIAELEGELAKANELLPTLQENIKKTSEKFELAKKAVENQKKNLEDLQPIFSQVRKHDTLISEKEKNLNPILENIQNLEKQSAEQIKSLHEQNTNLENQNQLLSEKEAWANENMILNELVSNFVAIEQEHTRLNNTLQEIERHKLEIASLKKNLEQKTEEYSKAELKFKEKERLASEKNYQLSKLNTQLTSILEGKNLEELKKKQADLVLFGKELKILCDAQSAIEQNEIEIKRLNQFLADAQQESSELELKIEQDNKDATDLKSKINLLEENIQLSKLVLSFEEHRDNLEDGKPCPLCGSNEHPFAEGNIPAIGTKEQELSNYKSKEQELKNTLFTNTQKEAKLSYDIKYAIQNLDKEQTKLTENTKKSNNSLLDIKHKFPDFALPEGYEKTEFLSNTLELKREEFSANDKIIESADALKKEIETLQNNLIPKLNEEKQEAERLKFAAENGKSLAAQQLSEKQKTCEENLEIYMNKNNELSQKLEKYSVKDLDSLSVRLKEWNENLKLKEQLNIAINDVKNKIELDNQNLSTTDDKLKNHQKAKNDLETQIKEQKDARTEIFGEKSVDDEEQTLNTLLNNASKELSDAEIEKNTANTELEKCRAIISEKEKSLSEKTTNRTFDKSREQLEIELDEKKNAHQELIRKLAIDNKILSDDAINSKNSEDKRKEKDQQSAIYWNWANLNTLLGSPDGKKFRNFAQSLTFEHLIALSNQQLQKMSDRYILKRTEAFDNPFQLSVIDRYQNNQERTSENLSGGEKFIVSLSLALGLANMAGKNMRIDTMFIDEGFGTLDSEYLDVAISALSNLQSEGKIIGVISHMPDLKERIATHIEVIPGGNGHSKIQVKY